MLQIGLTVDFVNWIMACVILADFAVLINGSPSKVFKSSWGLMTGMSPFTFIFLLIVEDLSLLISVAKLQGKIHGISFLSTLDITHLLFIDDGTLWAWYFG